MAIDDDLFDKSPIMTKSHLNWMLEGSLILFKVNGLEKRQTDGPCNLYRNKILLSVPHWNGLIESFTGVAVACAQSGILGDAAAGKNIDPSVKSAALARQCSVNSMQCERRFDSWPATRKQQQQQQSQKEHQRELGRRVKIDDDVAIRSCVTLIDQSVSQLGRRPRHSKGRWQSAH